MKLWTIGRRRGGPVFLIPPHLLPPFYTPLCPIYNLLSSAQSIPTCVGAPARGALYGNVVLFWWIFIVCASLLALHLRIFIVFGGGAWKSIKTGNSNNLGMREALSCRTCILLFYTFFCGSHSRIHFFYV